MAERGNGLLTESLDQGCIKAPPHAPIGASLAIFHLPKKPMRSQYFNFSRNQEFIEYANSIM